MAAGETNKTIAAELVLSERTVDRHVSNIFAKLRLLLACGGHGLRVRARLSERLLSEITHVPRGRELGAFFRCARARDRTYRRPP